MTVGPVSVQQLPAAPAAGTWARTCQSQCAAAPGRPVLPSQVAPGRAAEPGPGPRSTAAAAAASVYDNSFRSQDG